MPLVVLDEHVPPLQCSHVEAPVKKSKIKVDSIAGKGALTLQHFALSPFQIEFMFAKGPIMNGKTFDRQWFRSEIIVPSWSIVKVVADVLKQNN